ncbi:hypothetical protein A4X13_0g7146 [Tilletia indica]|uniref:Uncharacterized protein n=1 Tax=Tilletia indica TaxID=43049 RepID=A0A8T8SKH7_9BASI|nr:hypothetical protein A4X13_0g7146 [Tilletia indica]
MYDVGYTNMDDPSPMSHIPSLFMVIGIRKDDPVPETRKVPAPTVVPSTSVLTSPSGTITTACSPLRTVSVTTIHLRARFRCFSFVSQLSPHFGTDFGTATNPFDRIRRLRYLFFTSRPPRSIIHASHHPASADDAVWRSPALDALPYLPDRNCGFEIVAFVCSSYPFILITTCGCSFVAI